MMVDILSQRTTMAVLQVEDGLPVRENHVYVIRPGHVLTIRDGWLHLGAQLGSARAANRPVDDFFKSLAAEQRERAIAIIMSGMGSNGAAGAQAIKAVGGLCIAQEPESAKFPSMPRHLIDAGNADYILSPRDMPDVLLSYAGHPYARGERQVDADVPLRRDQGNLRDILTVLRNRTRHDFGGYRKPTLLRRVQRRMGLARLTEMDDYVRLLRQTPGEVTALADDLLIHVTGFFRDPEAWEALRKRVIVPLIASREPDAQLRCWVTACSTGDEAYTLAILLVEEAERVGKPLDIKVFATDMADRTLTQARAGVYPGGIEADVSPERLERFFQKEDAVYRVQQELRERVVFAPQNVVQDPPFSRLDIATCRNLLIYLEPELQQRVLALLHFGLREGGALFLGSSETIAGADGVFEPIDSKARIFRRIGATRHGLVDFPLPHALRGVRRGGASPDAASESSERRPGPRPTFAQVTRRALLEHHLPAAVLVDRDFRILYFQGDTRVFLGQPTGEPTRDLMALASEGVRTAVRVALRRAAEQNTAATVLDGWIETEPGRRTRLAITASPATDSGFADHFVVSFAIHEDAPADPHEDVTRAANAIGQNGGDSTEELRRLRDELQSTVEELQTTNEEMKAAAEEASSVNEELQSTNEELETSKEEMQSLNEELNTVNAQLRAKMEEHQSTSNDLASLLSSTDIAVLFLDPQLRIRRFTPPMRELFDFIASDLGRLLSDFARKFTDPELESDARAVLEKLVPIEREIAAASGRWFLRRITPYRTADNHIDGVVVAFLDITSRVRTAARLAETARLLDLTHDGIIIRDLDNRILHWNRGASQLYGYSADEAIGQDLQQLLQTQLEPEPAKLVKRLLKQDHMTGEVIQTTRDGRRLTLLCRWALDRDARGRPSSILTTTTDISDRKRAEQALRDSDERFRLLVEGAHDFAMLMFDPTGRITAWNVGAQRLFGYSDVEAIGQEAAIIFTPEDRAAGAMAAEFSQAAREGQASDERWHVRKDGSRFWGSGVLHHLGGKEAGVPTRGFVKVLRDETTRKQAEDALGEAKRTAEAANAMKDEFLATLSHELRTPLSAILLWAEIGKRNTGNPAQVSESLTAIKTSGEAQKALIEDLLDTSRITSGKVRLDLQDVEAAALVQDAIETVTPASDTKGILVAADLDAKAGVVSADPDRFRQVVWNLLTNAVKFTPSGGRIDVTLRRVEGNVEITVADNGQGISAEFLPDIFTSFSQADGSSTRRHGGLGLGLAICRQLIELHGGTLRAESPGLERGATFVVQLPLAMRHGKAVRRRPKAVKPKKAPAKDTDDLKNVKILLVEDDVETRKAVAILLRLAGADVIAVESAAAAVDLFKQLRPDAIVSDIGMPGEDGNSLIRRLRTMEIAEGFDRTPALALSAFARTADVDDALTAGFDRHIEYSLNSSSRRFTE